MCTFSTEHFPLVCLNNMFWFLKLSQNKCCIKFVLLPSHSNQNSFILKKICVLLKSGRFRRGLQQVSAAPWHPHMLTYFLPSITHTPILRPSSPKPACMPLITSYLWLPAQTRGGNPHSPALVSASTFFLFENLACWHHSHVTHGPFMRNLPSHTPLAIAIGPLFNMLWWYMLKNSLTNPISEPADSSSSFSILHFKCFSSGQWTRIAITNQTYIATGETSQATASLTKFTSLVFITN